MEGIASRVLEGDRRALSRSLSLIEDQTPEGRALLDRLYSPAQRAHRVGITGPPGSGKSTLVNELTSRLRAREETVGILAVDPSSPFTGGAILGDRIRMQTHYGDPGVFIRSMASRGSLGGLASTTHEAAELLGVAGYDWILVETVGVGQSEMEVVEATDTTVLVLVPESGDAVQVMKAGLMEAGDLFVINKFDREGGEHLEKEISLMLEMARERSRETEPGEGVGAWQKPILRAVAFRGEGIDQLVTAIDRHREFLQSDPARSEQHQTERINRQLQRQLRDRLLYTLKRTGELERWLDESRSKVLSGEASPYALVDGLVAGLMRGKAEPRSRGGHGGREKR
jgi:LAO/AO transport system kinase